MCGLVLCQRLESAGKEIVIFIDGVQLRNLDYNDEVIKDPPAWFDPKNAWNLGQEHSRCGHEA